MECGKTRCDYFQDNGWKYFKLKKGYAETFSEITGIENQTQHCSGNRQLSIELIDVVYFLNKENIIANESKSVFHSYISDYNEQDNCG